MYTAYDSHSNLVFASEFTFGIVGVHCTFQHFNANYIICDFPDY